MAENQENGRNENQNLAGRINDFIQKNRKGIVVCLGVILVVVAGFITVYGVLGHLRERAWSRVEELSVRYETLKAYIGQSDEEALAKKADVDTLRQELSEFASKNKGFPAARAQAMIASIYRDEKNWAEAESAWIRAAAAAGKNYFAPVSYFNAAVAAEEQGKQSEAVGYYNRALESMDIFPAAPRAQFSIGRIQEAQGTKDAALESYRLVLSRWPQDTFWADLAQTRILVLEGNAQ